MYPSWTYACLYLWFFWLSRQMDPSWTYVCICLPMALLQMDLYRTYAWIYLWICLCHIMIQIMPPHYTERWKSGRRTQSTHTHTHTRTYSWSYPRSYSVAIPGLRPGSNFLQLFLDFSEFFHFHFAHDLYDLKICHHTTHTDGTAVALIASGPIPGIIPGPSLDYIGTSPGAAPSGLSQGPRTVRALGDLQSIGSFPIPGSISGPLLELFLDLFLDHFWTYFWTCIGTSPGAAPSGLPRRPGTLRALGDLQSSGSFPIPGPMSGPLLDLYLDLFLDLSLDLFLDLCLGLPGAAPS
jgi:hypothetical protein